MNGFGILKGLGVTLKHFIDTYIEDIRWLGRGRYRTVRGLQERSSAQAKGVFTVQYPEEKIATPEEFRFLPFLVYEEGPNGEKNFRCTACGICSKVCPPQCIWILRASDPNTGRPLPTPADFQIDVDICMNCGMCAEFCPFDAIKMDHDYEIAAYDRLSQNIYHKEKLGKPVSYYSKIRPTNFAREEASRAEKEAAKAAGKKPSVETQG